MFSTPQVDYEYVDDPKAYLRRLERRVNRGNHTIDHVTSMTECRIAVTVSFLVFDKTVHVDVSSLLGTAVGYGLYEWEEHNE